MLGRMEKSGLVERKQDPNDQRVSRVYITDKGKEVCKKSAEVMMQINTDMFSNFSEEEKIIMRRLLIQMRDNLINSSDEKLDLNV
jgi:DNA-binding MarR family transcriptional regulator